MIDAKINTFFVSEKISKVRWVPEYLKDSLNFVTGSWDCSNNFLRIWRIMKNQYADDYHDFAPKCSDKLVIQGDVSGLEFLSEDFLAVSTSVGFVNLVNIKHSEEDPTLQKRCQSPLLHTFNSGKFAPCTGLSIYGKDIASVGEDGRLNIITGDTLRILKTIHADSCSLTSVAYINPQEILTANRLGVIKLFDIRYESKTIPPSFMISCEDDKKSNFVSCLTYHPTQKHIILAGSEEGSITIWDLRQPALPASYLSAHNCPITEIGFHRSQPTKLFTAAECGELWQWSEHSFVLSNNFESQMGGVTISEAENINPWLNGERTKNLINVTSLISDLSKPINSFDSHGTRIICGSDSEAVYYIDTII